MNTSLWLPDTVTGPGSHGDRYTVAQLPSMQPEPAPR
jgi:hypothetical protein